MEDATAVALPLVSRCRIAKAISGQRDRLAGKGRDGGRARDRERLLGDYGSRAAALSREIEVQHLIVRKSRTKDSHFVYGAVKDFANTRRIAAKPSRSA